jgi:hypothetical protein
MSEQEKTGGGFEWEAAQALEQMMLGLLRFTQALRNASSSGSASQLVPLLVRLDTVMDRLKEDEASQAHVNAMIVTLEEGVQAEQGKHAARLGMAEAAITTEQVRLTEHIKGER